MSRRTVFTAVGGKATLLKLAWDSAVAGDDEPVPMARRPAVQAMLTETRPAALLSMWVSTTIAVSSRTAPLARIIDVAADVDPEVAILKSVIDDERQTGSGLFITGLRAIGGVREDLTADQAADLCWVHTVPGTYRRLVLERGWTLEQFRDWLLRSMTSALLPPV